jgi:hypothetical protein
MAITYHTNYGLNSAELTFGGEWQYLLKVAENEALGFPHGHAGSLPALTHATRRGIFGTRDTDCADARHIEPDSRAAAREPHPRADEVRNRV